MSNRLALLSSDMAKGLKAGKSTNASFSYDTATSLTGKFIIAVMIQVKRLLRQTRMTITQ